MRRQQREESGTRHGAGDQPSIDPADQLKAGIARPGWPESEVRTPRPPTVF
jgi:hypothetical protein